MSMISKMSIQNNKEINISFNRSSFLRFMNAMGMISKDAQKSANISWRQYKRGEYKILKDTKELLS